MNFHVTKTAAIGAALATLGSLGAQGVYTEYGNACGSPFGLPDMNWSAPPTLGDALDIELSNARPMTPTLLLFGQKTAPIPMGACELLLVPETYVMMGTDVVGDASLPIVIPFVPAMVGLEFATQWFIVDSTAPNGYTMSEGGHGRLGMDTVTISGATTGAAAVGGPMFGLLGTTFGYEPDDLLVYLDDNNGARTLGRVKAAADNSLQMQFVMSDIDATGKGPIVVARGEGVVPVAPKVKRLGAPRDALAWFGDMSGNGSVARGPEIFTSDPGGGVVVPYAIDDGAIVFKLPADPCNNGGTYPAGTELDVYVRWTAFDCANPAAEMDYEFYQLGIEVQADMNADQLALVLRDMLSPHFNPNGFPNVEVTVQNGDWIRIFMSECSGSNPAGFIKIHC